MEFLESISIETLVVLFVGIVLIAVSIFASTNRNKLKEIGLPADGIIFSLSESSNAAGLGSIESGIKDKITVRFLTKDDTWITEPVKMNFLVTYTGQYKAGEHVKVLYNPDKPAEFIIESKQSELAARLGVGLVGLIFLLFGIYQCFNKYNE